AENGAALQTKFTLKIYEREFVYNIPVIHKWTDAVKGEQMRPVVIIPEISISVNKKNYVFTNDQKSEILVNIASKKDSAKGKIYIDLPPGWIADKSSLSFNLKRKDDQSSFFFKVSPGINAQSGEARIRAEVDNKNYQHKIIELDYPHIMHQTVLKEVKFDLIKLDIDVVPKRIGYIMGSGDEIPSALSQLGYEVELLSDNDIELNDLSEFDVIICGIRAFNTRENLERQQKSLIEFVEMGGTWIVQHNTRFGFQVEQIGPYPFSTDGRDRISEENSPIEILVPDHQIFNYPNRITVDDFNGWIQERGLYFADSWEGKLYPLLAGNDEGEHSKLGGLLYSNYGKGVFIFTAYSWFRQLPAGVPGAYRLFVNMISAKGKK
ncbi:MAG: hypothetical protein R3250_12945, partial [Melioribacteraceae bacterium]|nr:hypothetical protein [Melioribacteraceae bacterium]